MAPHHPTAAPEEEIKVSLPEDDLPQDSEWCDVHFESGARRVRFHDYAEIYEVPGLYERIFYDLLRCTSPRTIANMLAEQMDEGGVDQSDVTCLDLGAGNGIMGEEIRRIGMAGVVGVDIIDEAREAAFRDRPEVYDAYLVTDIRDLSPDEAEVIAESSPGCLTCVAALGFGDIPPDAFAAAWNMIADDGVVGFNIKEDFLDVEADQSGFSRMIVQSIDDGTLDVANQVRYRHRDSASGQPLHYVAITGSKRGLMTVS